MREAVLPAVAARGTRAEAAAAAPSTAARIPSKRPCRRFHWRGWLLSDSARRREPWHWAAALV